MAKSGYYQAVRTEISRLLKEKRMRSGLSKYAISKRSGISESMLSLVERGLRNPSVETLLRIADALEVDLSAIIKKAQVTATKRG